ncbi:hypothetical protein [Pyrobaculum aerophilum]|uniref:Uncharacterized protein n=1 Tax=Pyrobaculum aerophilum TaxID=13773 RepID=A0A371R4R5_9CREN|nr:hypothetical protein [Pyrobaculum aerophilum]RFA95741.1 hypothetical protein CGL51_07010 [Pyrobaculum aerophilum]RFA99066.1 hypothetical protein CGL52_05570 [Pyrobaculum aerophilum]
MAYRLIRLTFKRDVYSKPIASLIATGWAVSVSLASLGSSFAAVVSSINMLALVASLIAMVLSAHAVAGDRDGLLEAYLSAWGRLKYITGRIAANSAVSALLVAIISTPYLALRWEWVPPLGALLASLPSSLIGTAVGISSKERAPLVAIVVWSAVTLIYDVVVAFLSLILPLGDEAILALQVANFFKVATLLATSLVDPYLLTLGPLGEFVVSHWGVQWAYSALSSIYASWTIALILLVVDLGRKADL